MTVVFGPTSAFSLRAADLEDAAAPDRDGLRLRLSGVHGPDFAADEYDIGSDRRRHGRARSTRLERR